MRKHFRAKLDSDQLVGVNNFIDCPNVKILWIHQIQCIIHVQEIMYDKTKFQEYVLLFLLSGVIRIVPCDLSCK